MLNQDIDILQHTTSKKEISEIIDKLKNNTPITEDQAQYLFNEASVAELGILSNYVKTKLHEDNVFYVKNIHIEPTNICIFNCAFCSYRRGKTHSESWEYSIMQIMDNLQNKNITDLSEIHITGGVHPERGLEYYASLLQEIKNKYPHIYLKAYSAVEIDFIAKKEDISYYECLSKLKNAGLSALPGGGAEIFDETIRAKIAGEKVSSKKYIEIHQAAHKLGIESNITMLYGHLESIENRIDHLKRVRDLQQETGKINAFIPLKFKNKNNRLSHLKETSIIDDIKTYAVSRIYLNNVPHIKAYWPMLGKQNTGIMLHYGVDDIDGTIEDTTKIYSMAGSEEENPGLTPSEAEKLIKTENKIPILRFGNYDTDNN